MSLQIDIPIRYLLAPILIWQGLRIRRTALILPEADGPRSGVSGSGADLRLLILGDSSAAGVGAAHQKDALSGQLTARLAQRFAVDWTLIARTGATSKDALTMLGGARETPFDVALIALGVNDVTRGVSVARFIKRQSAICQHLRQEHGVRRIIVTGLPPLGSFPALSPLLQWILGAQAGRMDARLQDWIQTQPDCSYLGFDLPLEADLMASDGFHPNVRTYALWAEAAANRIASVLAPEF